MIVVSNVGIESTDESPFLQSVKIYHNNGLSFGVANSTGENIR